MTQKQLKAASLHHDVEWSGFSDVGEGRLAFSLHECSEKCSAKPTVGIFKRVLTRAERNKQDYNKRSKAKAANHRPAVSSDDNESATFPPEAVPGDLVEEIIRGFCNDTSREALEEVGCACCGSLCNRASSRSAKDRKIDMSLLIEPHATRLERRSLNAPIRRIDGPVLAEGCDRICITCYDALAFGRRPLMALANGLWLGEVPDVLKGLSYAEMQMISKVRHNRAVVRVRSGRGKMIANAVMFSSPIPQVCRVLPPHKDELNEVIAFTFLGTARPTPEEFKRTPMLMRLDVVEAALRWLCPNNPSYHDVEISQENIDSYRVEDPLVWEYKQLSDDDTIQEATATSMANEDVDAPDEGRCPFVVHGLT
ncbi:hypothetical protein EV122DRAFT_226298, partial [Schizophyllum commune]